jgi:hypothetical protein
MVGIANLSCYSQGMMGYRTPNIDRIVGCGDFGHRSVLRHGTGRSFPGTCGVA